MDRVCFYRLPPPKWPIHTEHQNSVTHSLTLLASPWRQLYSALFWSCVNCCVSVLFYSVIARRSGSCWCWWPAASPFRFCFRWMTWHLTHTPIADLSSLISPVLYHWCWGRMHNGAVAGSGPPSRNLAFGVRVNWEPLNSLAKTNHPDSVAVLTEKRLQWRDNGLWSKRRPVKTATPKRRQKWLYSKRRQTQTTPTVLVKPI